MDYMILYFAVMMTIIVCTVLLLTALVAQFAGDLRQHRLNNRLNNLR